MRAKRLTTVAAILLGWTALLALVGSGSSLPGWAGHARTGGAPAPLLKVSIEAQSAPFLQDQPVDIVFHAKNITAHPLAFIRERNDWMNNFQVDVVTESGEPAPRSPNDDLGPLGHLVSTMGDGLQPGEERVDIANLSDHYVLAPGTYRITGRKGLVSPDGTGRVVWAVSNTIKITVVAGDDSANQALNLHFLQRLRVYDPVMPPNDETIQLTNSGDHDVEVVSNPSQPWFHDLSLDFRTLAGDPVPRKRDADGQEVKLEKDRANPQDRPATPFNRPMRPGDKLYRDLRLSNLYELSPGTAYTLTAHLSLETSDGPIALVSDTITMVIKSK